eukprot:1166166-Prorocentrum_minimum.AAC.1
MTTLGRETCRTHDVRCSSTGSGQTTRPTAPSWTSRTTYGHFTSVSAPRRARRGGRGGGARANLMCRGAPQEAPWRNTAGRGSSPLQR